MASKYVHVIRKPKDWKNLHPAPNHLPEEKNCCDCIAWTGVCGNQEGSSRHCIIQGKQMHAYDECGAFTKRNEQESEPKP